MQNLLVYCKKNPRVFNFSRVAVCQSTKDIISFLNKIGILKNCLFTDKNNSCLNKSFGQKWPTSYFLALCNSFGSTEITSSYPDVVVFIMHYSISQRNKR